MEDAWMQLIMDLPVAAAMIWTVKHMLNFIQAREAVIEQRLQKRDAELQVVIEQNTNAIRQSTEMLGETRAFILLVSQSLNGSRPPETTG